jgi:hypothetical protein
MMIWVRAYLYNHLQWSHFLLLPLLSSMTISFVAPLPFTSECFFMNPLNIQIRSLYVLEIALKVWFPVTYRLLAILRESKYISKKFNDKLITIVPRDFKYWLPRKTSIVLHSLVSMMYWGKRTGSKQRNWARLFMIISFLMSLKSLLKREKKSGIHIKSIF